MGHEICRLVYYNDDRIIDNDNPAMSNLRWPSWFFRELPCRCESIARYWIVFYSEFLNKPNLSKYFKWQKQQRQRWTDIVSTVTYRLGVKGQRRSKFGSISNGTNNKVNLLGTDRHSKLLKVTSSFDLPRWGQRWKKVKIWIYFNLMAKVTKSTCWARTSKM